MEKAFLVAILATMASPFGTAQPPVKQTGYTFHANYLGMTLTDFKNSNRSTIYINTGNPRQKLNKHLSREVETPLCTDNYEEIGMPNGFGFPTDVLPGEVVCNASPGVANPNGLIIADGPVSSVVYRFLGDRLHEIDIRFSARRYDSVRTAFQAKYGRPSEELSPSVYQNTFGARWEGENAFWQKGTQSILLHEGSGNGPGQDEFDSVFNGCWAKIKDSSLEPLPEASTPDF